MKTWKGEGEGMSQKVILLHKPNLVKGSTKEEGGQKGQKRQKRPKIVHMIYGPMDAPNE